MDKEILMVCIADLGLAIKEDDPRAKSEKCGTPAYVDPEVLNGGGFTLKSDIFSLGSLMFNLITRKLIFRGSNLNEVLYRNKHESAGEMINLCCQNVTPEFRDLLSQMVCRNSKKRFTAE